MPPGLEEADGGMRQMDSWCVAKHQDEEGCGISELGTLRIGERPQCRAEDPNSDRWQKS